MSDDFDKWFNDDETPDEDDDFDLSDLDWLADDDDEPQSGNAERTGLTGQLDWQQTTGEGDDTGKGDDDDLADLDWLREDTDEGTPGRDDSRTGVTGMLNWRQDEQDRFEQQIDEAEAAADDELPAWMQGVDDNLEGADGPTMPIQYDGPVPDYAAELDAGLGDDDEDDDPLDEIPDWMKSPDEAEAEDVYTEEDVEETAPDWLQDTGDLYEAPAAEDEAEDVPDWMKDTGALYASTEDEAEPAPGWMQDIDTGSLDDTFVDEDGDGVPDWMQDMGVDVDADEAALYDAQPDAADEDAVPDWMQGMDVEDPDDALFDAQPAAADEDAVPDWMQGMDVEEVEDFDDTPVEESEDEALPAWMRDDAPAAEVEEESFTMMDEGDDDLDDLFGDEDDDLDDLLTQTEAPTSTDFENMFGEDDFDFDEEDDFDLLGELTGDDDDDLAALLGDDEAVDDFDLLGELTGDDEQPAAVAATDDDLDDLFGTDDEDDLFGDETYDDEQPVAVAASEDDLDDLFGADDEDDLFGDETYDDEQPAAVAASEDDLDDLFGTDDEDDLFGDETYDDEQPAAVAATDDDLDDLFGADDEDDLFGDETYDDEQPAAVAASEDDLDDLFGADDEDDDDDLNRVLAAFDDDLDAMLGDDDDMLPSDDEPFDWFGEQEREAAPTPAPADDLDWLRDVDGDYDEDAEEAPPQAPAARATEDEEEYDLEAFLSSFGEDRALAALPQTGELDQGDVDFDMLFGEDYDDDTDDEPAEDDTFVPLSPDAPEWLTDLSQESAGRESAASLVRGQRDRPVDELPDRLRALRERGIEFTPKAEALEADTGALDDVLQGVRNTLPAVVIEQGAASNITSNIALTDEQNRHAAILQRIVGSSAADAETEAQTQQRRFRVSERAVIAVILAVLIALPFFVDALRIGELPPPTFAVGTQERAFIEIVDAVPAGEPVLVAVEYGPSGAAELDGATESLLIHLLSRGAIPVIVGGNPVGMLRVQALMDDIAAENTLVVNEDYVIGGYIVGDVVGLRRFNEYVDTLVETDLSGESTGFNVESLDDFTLLVLVTETAERARLYGEQIRPDTTRPLLGITGQGAAPLAEPYLDGLLVGYEDAYTYRGLVQILLAGGSIDVPLPTDTPTPTEEVTPPVVEVTPEATAAVTEDVTPEVTADAAVTEEPTDVIPTATAPPTLTAPPTETAVPTETVPPTETAPPTMTEEPIRVVVVTAAQAVNVRSGPSTLDPPVATLEPGAEALILGANADESWYNILLEDATEGWIAASVVRVEDFAAETPEAEPTDAATATPQPTVADETPTPSPTLQPSQIGTGIVVSDGAVNVRSGPATTNGVVGAALPGEELIILGANADESWYNVELPDGTVGWIAAFLLQVELDESEVSKPRIVARQPIPPEATEPPTEEVTAEAASTDEVVAEAPANLALRFPDRDDDTYRDERWYSMTIGLIAAAVVIAGGTLINLLRALRRRRAQRE